jgi:hypothetical protein
MDYKEVRWDVVHWIHVAQDKNKRQALVNMIMNLQVQQNIGNFLKS